MGKGTRWLSLHNKKKVNSEPSGGMESKAGGKEEKEERRDGCVWERFLGATKRETEVEVGETEAGSRKSKDRKKAGRGRQN